MHLGISLGIGMQFVGDGLADFDFLDPDFLSEWYLAAWLTWEDGLNDLVGSYDLSWQGGTPSTVSYNGKTLYDLDGANHYADCATGPSGVYGAHFFGDFDDASFTDYDGLIGGQSTPVGAIGHSGTTGMYRSGVFGAHFEYSSRQRTNIARGLLPTPGLTLVSIQNPWQAASFSNIRLGQDRTYTGRRHNGPWGFAGLLKKPMPTYVKAMVEWWLHSETDTLDALYVRNEHNAATKVQVPVAEPEGRTLLNAFPHQTTCTVRPTEKRGSGLRMPPLDDRAINDRRQVEGIDFFLPTGGTSQHCDPDLTTWTNSDATDLSVSASTDGWADGEDSYELVASGDATLTDAIASYTGPRSCRIMARVTSGTVPASSTIQFANSGTPTGVSGDLSAIGSDWTIVDCWMSGTSNQIVITFPAGADCTVEAAVARVANGYEVAFPPPHPGVTGASGTDSTFRDSLYGTQHPTKGQMLFIMAPYGGWPGTGARIAPFANFRILNVGTSGGTGWRIRMQSRTDPVLEEGGGTAMATHTGEVMAAGWNYIWLDWSSADSEVGFQWGSGTTRKTHASSEYPSSNPYIGNESAVNQSHCITAFLPWDDINTQEERETIEAYLDSILPDPTSIES